MAGRGGYVGRVVVPSREWIGGDLGQGEEFVAFYRSGVVLCA